MTAWVGKPCVGCDGKKGPLYRTRKYCGNCQARVRRANREVAHRTRVARVYGIGREQYDAMYADQDGRCALCRRATGATRRLSVDHDHLTSEVRGLVCRPCNDVLGHARDDVAYFQRCAAYLSDPPARRVLGYPGGAVDAPTGL